MQKEQSYGERWVGMEKWGNVGLSFEHVFLVLVGFTLSGDWHASGFLRDNF